jgi:hypothetical protein
MGPFTTIELNAPSASRITACAMAFLSPLSAADPAIYCGKGLDHVLAEWGEAPT